jgi:hypothetical protein
MVREIAGLRVSAFTVALAATAVFLCGEASAEGKHKYQGPNYATVTKTINNGESVVLGFVDSMTVQYLNAGRSVLTGTGATQGAFLVFQGTTYDPTSKVCTTDPVLGQICTYTRTFYDFAGGDIPVDELVVTANGAHLLAEISNNASFYYQRCVVDDVAMTTECTSLPPTGTVDVTWVKTSDNYYKSIGYTEQKTGPQLIKIRANSQQYSSHATGSIFGMSVGTTADATFGLTSTTTIDIIHAP